MEFRRVETKRTLRYAERVKDKAEAKLIFVALQKHSLNFEAKIEGYATMSYRVLSVLDDRVEIISMAAPKVRLTPKFDEINSVEVDSNCDIIAEEFDQGGRWARIIP